MERIGMGMSASMAVDYPKALAASFQIGAHYRFEYSHPNGDQWVAEGYNRVPTEGLNHNLTEWLKGAAYTATPFVGLVSNAGFGAYSASDTAAQINGTNGWTEFTGYSEAVRQTLTLGTAAGGVISNTASKAVFSFNANGSLNGAFVVTSSTKAGTGGSLLSEVTFSGGAQSITSGGTGTITITFTATST